MQKQEGQTDRVLRVQIYRRDAADIFTIIFQYPDSEKGKGYYRSGDDLYLYLPSTREFVYRNRKDNVGSTDVRTDLFGQPKTLEQYWATYQGTATVSKWECDVVRLDGKSLDVSFPVQKWYFRKSDGLPVKVENFSVSETLLRTFYYIDYAPVAGGKFLFTKLLAVNHLEKGQKTCSPTRTSPPRPSPTTPSPRPSWRSSPDERARLAWPAALLLAVAGLAPLPAQDLGRGGHLQRRGLRPERGRQPGAGAGQQAGVPGRRHVLVEQHRRGHRRPSTATLPRGAFSAKAFVRLSVPSYGSLYLGYNLSHTLYQGDGGALDCHAAGRRPVREHLRPVRVLPRASTWARRCSSGWATSSWPGAPPSSGPRWTS